MNALRVTLFLYFAKNSRDLSRSLRVWLTLKDFFFLPTVTPPFEAFWKFLHIATDFPPSTPKRVKIVKGFIWSVASKQKQPFVEPVLFFQRATAWNDDARQFQFDFCRLRNLQFMGNIFEGPPSKIFHRIKTVRQLTRPGFCFDLPGHFLFLLLTFLLDWTDTDVPIRDYIEPLSSVRFYSCWLIIYLKYTRLTTIIIFKDDFLRNRKEK